MAAIVKKTFIFILAVDAGRWVRNRQASKWAKRSNAKKVQLKQARSTQTSCGNVRGRFDVGPGVDIFCADEKCIVACANPSHHASVKEITCDPDSYFFTPFGGRITCDPTVCGSPESWDFGADYTQMKVDCAHQNNRKLAICNVNCELNGQPGFSLDMDGNDFTTIICQSDGTLLPASGSLTLKCAETPCGELRSEFDVGNVQSNCSSDGCEFSCDSEAEMASYSSVKCTRDGYEKFDSIFNKIECVPKRETPCGNIADHFEISAEAEVTCSPFMSIFQTKEVTCQAKCPPNKILDGDLLIKCEGGSFKNENRAISCKETLCGDIREKFAVENGVETTCVNNVCHISCSSGVERPIVDSIVCNLNTLDFEDIVLWENTPTPMRNPAISCEPSKETLCGNANQFVNVASDTSITCDYATSSCQLSCSTALPFHAQANVPTIYCDPNSRKFSVAFDAELNCGDYAISCGRLEDTFIMDEDISSSCIYDQISGTDICDLTCSDPNLVVDKQQRITCTHSTMSFDIPHGSRLGCVIPPETPCGYIYKTFDIDSTVAEVTCHGNDCFFSCINEHDYLPIPRVRCIEQTKVYYPASANIHCRKVGKSRGDFDTACGNVALVGSNSLKSCDATTGECSFTCPAGKLLHGVKKASCIIVQGLQSWAYETNLNVGETFDISQPFSKCVDTMCGDLSDIMLNIHQDVQIDISALQIYPYGTIELKCPNGGVISGLQGQDQIGCRSDGFFDVLFPYADVKCSETSCGNVEQVMTLGNDASAVCENEVCQFHCPADEHGLTTVPSLNQAVCDTKKGTFLTSETKVECQTSCLPFGHAGSRFELDENVMIFCDEFEPGKFQYCDILCKKPLFDAGLKPGIRETGQKLEKIRCRPTGYYEKGTWESVIFDMYGTPHDVRIKQVGLDKHHLVCEEQQQNFIEDKVDCGAVRNSYTFMSQVDIRCTTEICAFICPIGFRLTSPTSRVICTERDGSPKWWPPIDQVIGCAFETSTTATITTTTISTTTTNKKSKKDKKKDKKDKKDKKSKKPKKENVSTTESDMRTEIQPEVTSPPVVGNLQVEIEQTTVPVVQQQNTEIVQRTTTSTTSTVAMTTNFDVETTSGTLDDQCDIRYFPLKINSNVVSDCDEKGCAFSCPSGMEVNAAHVPCKEQEWIIPKKIRKILCLAPRACDPKKVSVSEKVVSECSETECSFSCDSPGLVPNVATAQCQAGKWKFATKARIVFCVQDTMARFSALANILNG